MELRDGSAQATYVTKRRHAELMQDAAAALQRRDLAGLGVESDRREVAEGKENRLTIRVLLYCAC